LSLGSSFFACLPFHTKEAHFLEMVGLHPFRFLVGILAIWIDALVYSPLTGGPLFSINASSPEISFDISGCTSGPRPNLAGLIVDSLVALLLMFLFWVSG
jgi:hypothetical protein